ncbi:unnamed protein product [Linum trigynum]|uniref:Uncharacterized protein n=1 Tax=Linum trigynum TaxID=586398 RepID=A0AAV2EWA5_9ROSI
MGGINGMKTGGSSGSKPGGNLTMTEKTTNKEQGGSPEGVTQAKTSRNAVQIIGLKSGVLGAIQSGWVGTMGAEPDWSSRLGGLGPST